MRRSWNERCSRDGDLRLPLFVAAATWVVGCGGDASPPSAAPVSSPGSDRPQAADVSSAPDRSPSEPLAQTDATLVCGLIQIGSSTMQAREFERVRRRLCRDGLTQQVGVDRAHWEGCLADLRARPPSSVDAIFLRPRCRLALPRRAGPGAACDLMIGCAEGLYCLPTPAGLTSCEPIVTLGAPCTYEDACGPQGQCRQNACTPRLGAGQRCRDGDRSLGSCPLGLSCANETCRLERGKEGEACHPLDWQPCELGLGCEAGKCVHGRQPGDPCDNASQCASGECLMADRRCL